MTENTGSNIQDIKSSNRILVLKHIATHKGISRIDISRITGLSKMTVGNIVTELISAGLIEENNISSTTNFSGRKPISLFLSANSPCICGILIKRSFFQIILSDLGGNIFFQLDHPYQMLSSSQELLNTLEKLFMKCKEYTSRRILAIGISCVGPLNSRDGCILNPPYFYGIKNLSLAPIIQQITGLPTFLVNDASAGAFSEKLYGQGANIPNFAYLHIMNGIGSGFILNHTLYEGDSGQSGEIGHTSINFNGPPCDCGNRGCLDLYANLQHIHNRIRDLSILYPTSLLTLSTTLDWNDIITAGNRHDPLALSVLEEFCSYIAYALTNTLNLLNLSTIFVGYPSNNDGFIIEEILSHKLNTLVMFSKSQPIAVIHSTFDSNAPLIGSIAVVVNKIFNKELVFEELDRIF